MRRVRIPVAEIEFVEGGNTLWVHSPTGGTAFRLQVTGRITSRRCGTNIGPSHADIVAQGDLVFCIGKDKADERGARGETDADRTRARVPRVRRVPRSGGRSR